MLSPIESLNTLKIFNVHSIASTSLNEYCSCCVHEAIEQIGIVVDNGTNNDLKILFFI
jgi:hypothetical protein